jgi:AcrR family transcriptional regulator
MAQDDPPARTKNAAAVQLGRRGGLVGGKARAAKLTAEHRHAIGRKAAEARWGRKTDAPDDASRKTVASQADRIVTIASRMFADRGFAQANMRDIAKEARVGLPTIYAAFGDKRDLYRHCCKTLLDRNEAFMKSLMDPFDVGPDKVYAFTYGLSIVQVDEAVPRLVQRIVADRRLAAVADLNEEFEPGLLPEVKRSVAMIDGAGDAHLRTSAIYALSFGLVEQASFYANAELARDPSALARYVLSVVLPDVDWRATGDRIEAAIRAVGFLR